PHGRAAAVGRAVGVLTPARPSFFLSPYVLADGTTSTESRAPTGGQTGCSQRFRARSVPTAPAVAELPSPPGSGGRAPPRQPRLSTPRAPPPCRPVPAPAPPVPGVAPP